MPSRAPDAPRDASASPADGAFRRCWTERFRAQFRSAPTAAGAAAMLKQARLWHSSLEPERDGSIVYELNVHHRSEFAALDPQSFRRDCCFESLVQGDGLLGSGGIDEARAFSLFRVAIECELRND